MLANARMMRRTDEWIFVCCRAGPYGPDAEVAAFEKRVALMGRVYECKACEFIGDAQEMQVHVGAEHLSPTEAPFACCVCALLRGPSHTALDQRSPPEKRR